MNKLRLELDELAIESFETVRVPAEKPGTVKGYQTATANSGGSCFDVTCRRFLCATEWECTPHCL